MATKTPSSLLVNGPFGGVDVLAFGISDLEDEGASMGDNDLAGS